MTEDGVSLSVEELVEYCRTQAGLLSGHVETIGGEIDALLDEIDEDISTVRAHLTERTTDAAGAPVSPSTAGPGGEGDRIGAGEEAETDVAALEDRLEEKQAVAEAKQARMAAFQDLAAAYLDLAEELESAVDDGREALDRVVRFERDRDAPAYFDDRRTVLEAAAESNDSSAE